MNAPLCGEELLDYDGVVVEAVVGGVEKGYCWVVGDCRFQGGEGGVGCEFGFVFFYEFGPTVVGVRVEPFAKLC